MSPERLKETRAEVERIYAIDPNARVSALTAADLLDILRDRAAFERHIEATTLKHATSTSFPKVESEQIHILCGHVFVLAENMVDAEAEVTCPDCLRAIRRADRDELAALVREAKEALDECLPWVAIATVNDDPKFTNPQRTANHARALSKAQSALKKLEATK